MAKIAKKSVFWVSNEKSANSRYKQNSTTSDVKGYFYIFEQPHSRPQDAKIYAECGPYADHLPQARQSGKRPGRPSD